MGSVSPSPQSEADILFGMEVLAATGPFDIGQAVVVANRTVLALEAADGTDLMLARIAELRERGRIHTRSGVGVLIKAPKARQDRRFDLPSIGPATVEAASRAGLAGIAVTAGATIIAEAPRVAQLADEKRIFVIGLHDSRPAQ
jgi:DUF1009 family protein